jgi:hypothetical protein
MGLPHFVLFDHADSASIKLMEEIEAIASINEAWSRVASNGIHTTVVHPGTSIRLVLGRHLNISSYRSTFPNS